METEDWEIYLFYRLEKGKIPRKENMQKKNDHKKQRRIRREQWFRYQRWKWSSFKSGRVISATDRTLNIYTNF